MKNLYRKIIRYLRWGPAYLGFILQHRRSYFAIPTHMSRIEQLLLYKLALSLDPGSRIVEIGSYLGASSSFLACAARRRNHIVYCVDTWHNDAMSESRRDTFDEFCRNIAPLRDRIRILRGHSTDLAGTFDKEIDLLFVDGDHSYEAVTADLRAWLGKVKIDGLVVMHDISWSDGVRRAVNEQIEPLRKQQHIVANTYWARIAAKPASEPSPSSVPSKQHEALYV